MSKTNPNARCIICNQDIPINKFKLDTTLFKEGYVYRCPNGCKIKSITLKKDTNKIEFR